MGRIEALNVERQELVEYGLDERAADALLAKLADAVDADADADGTWDAITREVLAPSHPFAVHRLLFARVHGDAAPDAPPAAAWRPGLAELEDSNLARLMRELDIETYDDLHAWSADDRVGFWGRMIERVGVVLKKPGAEVVDLVEGVERPRWLPGAELNIADSCFAGPADAPAIVARSEDGSSRTVTLGELEALTNRVANGVRAMGLGPGDPVGIVVPMHAEAVAIYLGLVKAGCPVISIAESFAPQEIEVRLRIGGAKAVFVQDVMRRGGKTLPLLDKLTAFDAPRAVVLPIDDAPAVALRPGDVEWSAFLPDEAPFESVARRPDDLANVLFSSGTTGDPKAIPWTHVTPIKCIVDAYLHHDAQPGDVLAWPTSLGWMMGPWLIFAALGNGGAIALYDGVPTSRGFCEFVRDAGVRMLGVVPTLVKAWRASGVIEGLDWSAIKLFSSTGECSNHDDMLYLMSRAGYRPMVEYCGGTEIGGGYITGTVVQPCVPAMFTTPALGLDFLLLDDDGRPASEGEVFLVPPSIGLSQTLLNRDHFETYYAGTPTGPDGEILRRHGDEIEALPGGFYRAHGRTDDTMNLGGIKVSSAEIERVLGAVDGVNEAAAIAVAPAGGGPSELVVYAVPARAGDDLADAKPAMQQAIKTHLNPLFRIADVVAIDALPRTASNKVMRRVLRAQYLERAGTAGSGAASGR